MDIAARLNELHAGLTCTSPRIGSQLPDYIVDLLDDTAAEEVETHLGDCVHCKRLYVTVLRFRAARAGRTHDKITSSLNNGLASSID